MLEDLPGAVWARVGAFATNKTLQVLIASAALSLMGGEARDVRLQPIDRAQAT
jgi:hypothetical protein